VSFFGTTILPECGLRSRSRSPTIVKYSAMVFKLITQLLIPGLQLKRPGFGEAVVRNPARHSFRLHPERSKQLRREIRTAGARDADEAHEMVPRLQIVQRRQIAREKSEQQRVGSGQPLTSHFAAMMIAAESDAEWGSFSFAVSASERCSAQFS